MRHFNSQRAIAVASVLLVTAALTGCSTPPATGSVVVSNETTEWAPAVDVTVTDEVGTVVGTATLESGQTHTFSDIPLGPVTVEADGLCTVATTLTTAHDTAQAKFSPTNCTI